MEKEQRELDHEHCKKCSGCIVQGVWHNCYDPFDVDPYILTIFAEAGRRKSNG